MAAQLRIFCFSRNCLLRWRKLGLHSTRCADIKTFAVVESHYWCRIKKGRISDPQIGVRASSKFVGEGFSTDLRGLASNKSSGFDGRTHKADETDSDSDEDGAMPIKHSTRTKTHKQKAAVRQKTDEVKVPRPSRYVFTDVKGEEEVYRWERRPLKPKMKSDWYTRQMLRLVKQNQVCGPVLAVL